ncbi:MAG: hypothetical protein Q9198_009029, partial [Flavoplaca austrocitrina]
TKKLTRILAYGGIECVAARDMFLEKFFIHVTAWHKRRASSVRGEDAGSRRAFSTFATVFIDDSHGLMYVFLRQGFHFVPNLLFEALETLCVTDDGSRVNR